MSLHSHHSRSMSLPAIRQSSRATQKHENITESKSKILDEIRHGISTLTNLYKYIDELLDAPLTQRAFRRHKHGKWIETWLDESVTYLDICCVTSQAMLVLKTSLVEIRSLLKRPTLDHDDLTSCVHRLRKVNRETNKSVVSTLKMITNPRKCYSSATLVGDDELVEVVRVLREASVASNSIFKSALLCLQSKGKGWCLVDKVPAIRRKKVDNVISSCLVSLQRLIKGYNGGSEIIQNMQEKLIGLERSMEEVEKEMDSLFRCLIHTRVSFLNLLSH